MVESSVQKPPRHCEQLYRLCFELRVDDIDRLEKQQLNQ